MGIHHPNRRQPTPPAAHLSIWPFFAFRTITSDSSPTYLVSCSQPIPLSSPQHPAIELHLKYNNMSSISAIRMNNAASSTMAGWRRAFGAAFNAPYGSASSWARMKNAAAWSGFFFFQAAIFHPSSQFRTSSARTSTPASSQQQQRYTKQQQ